MKRRFFWDEILSVTVIPRRPKEHLDLSPHTVSIGVITLILHRIVRCPTPPITLLHHACVPTCHVKTGNQLPRHSYNADHVHWSYTRIILSICKQLQMLTTVFHCVVLHLWTVIWLTTLVCMINIIGRVIQCPRNGANIVKANYYRAFRTTVILARLVVLCVCGVHEAIIEDVGKISAMMLRTTNVITGYLGKFNQEKFV